MISLNCMKLTPIRVECYAGAKADETPRRFRLEERTLEITEVLDRCGAVVMRRYKIPERLQLDQHFAWAIMLLYGDSTSNSKRAGA